MVIIKVCLNALFSSFIRYIQNPVDIIYVIWLLNTRQWKWQIFSMFFLMKNSAVIEHGSRTLHQLHKSHFERNMKRVSFVRWTRISFITEPPTSIYVIHFEMDYVYAFSIFALRFQFDGISYLFMQLHMLRNKYRKTERKY